MKEVGGKWNLTVKTGALGNGKGEGRDNPAGVKQGSCTESKKEVTKKKKRPLQGGGEKTVETESSAHQQSIITNRETRLSNPEDDHK